jgi:hypothetical protein
MAKQAFDESTADLNQVEKKDVDTVNMLREILKENLDIWTEEL